MTDALTRMARPVCMSLLATGLSSCAYFTESVDDEQAHCPVTKLSDNHQPFDFVARESLEKLIDRNANTDKENMGKTLLVRLNEHGTPLTNQQAKYDSAPWARDYSSVPWACVKDNRTDLTWEVKRNNLSLRDMNWTYTWYEPSLTDKYGYAGMADGGKCLEGTVCDTQAYVAAVNAKNLCGYNDWRLPLAFELHSILDRKDNCPGTCISQNYFPNTARGGYWSSSPFDEFVCYAWAVDFELDSTSGAIKNTSLHIRLVRGKWLTSINDSETDGPEISNSEANSSKTSTPP